MELITVSRTGPERFLRRRIARWCSRAGKETGDKTPTPRLVNSTPAPRCYTVPREMQAIVSSHEGSPQTGLRNPLLGHGGIENNGAIADELRNDFGMTTESPRPESYCSGGGVVPYHTPKSRTWSEVAPVAEAIENTIDKLIHIVDEARLSGSACHKLCIFTMLIWT